MPTLPSGYILHVLWHCASVAGGCPSASGAGWTEMYREKDFVL